MGDEGVYLLDETVHRASVGSQVHSFFESVVKEPKQIGSELGGHLIHMYIQDRPCRHHVSLPQSLV